MFVLPADQDEEVQWVPEQGDGAMQGDDLGQGQVPGGRTEELHAHRQGAQPRAVRVWGARDPPHQTQGGHAEHSYQSEQG